MKKGFKLLIALIISLSLFACGKHDKTKTTNTKEDVTKSHLTTKEIREFKTITYGTYPQTEEKDSAVISNLNSLAGTLPTNDDDALWTKFDNYYCVNTYKTTEYDPEYGEYTYYRSEEGYMWYIDLDIDSDGFFDYRGIYFTAYRPFLIYSYEGSSYQDENGYFINKTYWFKFEPIEWIVLDEENGKTLIMAKKDIDSTDYYWGNDGNHGNKKYDNNYELSHIRTWLNNDFYSIAFTLAEQEKIQTTLVDNSMESFYGVDAACVSNDTNDKVFLLSLKEEGTYFISDEEKIVTGTDYAKAQGLYVSSNGYSYWRLRSPNYRYIDETAYVLSNGYVTIGQTRNISIGIRPAMWIKTS